MRAFVAVAVVALCAAVAFGDEHFDYPFRLVRAKRYLEGKVGLGHFRVQVQVPPEPKDQSDQTIVFFTGALGGSSSITYEITNSGLALIWNAKHRWIALVGSVGCQPSTVLCKNFLTFLRNNSHSRLFFAKSFSLLSLQVTVVMLLFHSQIQSSV